MFTQSADFRRLASDLVGQLILPATPDYESARRVWNGMIDKRPRAIVRCGNADDVIAAVAFAKDKQMTVAVRGGGHNIAGNATCDNGLVIDLSSMKSIHVDPTSRRARAEGGCLWGELDAATQAFGLATNGGLMPSTGIAGFTLGVGLGYLMRSFVLACVNLISSEFVNAIGKKMSGNARINPI